MTANFLGEASVRDQQRLQDCGYSSLRLVDLLRRGLPEPAGHRPIHPSSTMCWQVWVIRELVSGHFASFPGFEALVPRLGPLPIQSS